MAEGLTGILTIAAAGLTQNQGLAVSAKLVSAVGLYNQNSLVTAIQNKLTSNNELLVSELRKLPNFMTGVLPNGIVITGINTNNVPTSLLTQANRLFPSVPKFIAIFQQVQSYVTNAYQFKNTVAKAQNTNFSDLGFQYQNYSDVMTGGVTSQFDVAFLPILAKELANLGTMFDTRQLTKLDDPGTLILNLIQQGLGAVGDLESRASKTGIDLNNVDSFDRAELIELLSTIQGSDLQNIITVTGFKPYYLDKITNLSMVLDTENLFSTNARQAFAPQSTLAELAKRLGNVGGSFADAAALSKFYSSISFKKFEQLSGMKSMMPGSMVDNLNQNLGGGSGASGSLTMLDLLGSVSGGGYVDDLTGINQINSFMITDSDISQLIAQLNAPVIDVGQIQPLIEKINTKPLLQSSIERGNQLFINISERLKLELENLVRAQIVPETVQPGADSVMNFVNSLHSIGRTSETVGARTVIENLATTDVYGEAVEAAIFEGQNLSNFAAVGIETKTKLS